MKIIAQLFAEDISLKFKRIIKQFHGHKKTSTILSCSTCVISQKNVY